MFASARLRAAWLVAGAIIVLAVGSSVVLGDEERVTGTKHDVASPGTPVCTYCHIPEDSTGERLWTDGPHTADSPLTGLKPLCFSCHDGTVAGSNDNFVFDPTRPEHAMTPGERGQDCDRCHDAHFSGYGNFIKLPGGANFCQDCHSRAGPTDHPVDVDAAEAGVTPVDHHWDPLAGDFTGTRLWDQEGGDSGGLVKCLSCHSPHGGQPGTKMSTVAASPSDPSELSICQACHQRGGGD